MPTVPTPEQIALVKQLLPSSALDSVDVGGYGWSDTFIQNLMFERDFTPTEAVRFFWLQRVNETVEYIDIGKPLSQIHRQAKEMLDYWDTILGKSLTAIGPTGEGVRQPISFGEIEGPWDA